MARPQDQRRWRTNTRRKRFEVYLPPEAVERLDTLAADRGQSRATVVAALIDGATPAAKPTPVAVSDACQPSAAVPQPGSSTETPRSGQYSFRRPRRADERRYEWIGITHDGRRIALGPDPARFWRWRGHYLDGSIFTREAKGNTRDEVARNLLNLPPTTGR